MELFKVYHSKFQTMLPTNRTLSSSHTPLHNPMASCWLPILTMVNYPTQHEYLISSTKLLNISMTDLLHNSSPA